jgi:type I restriction enzyme R subunit
MKKGWPKKSLGEICGFVRGPFGGSLKKSVFVADGFAVYEQQHAIYDQFDDIRYFIDDAKFREMQRFELRPNDLIMSCSGTMGKVAIVPENIRRGIINQALLKLTPTKTVSPEFLKYWMDSTDFQDSLKEQSGGAAIQNVASVSILKEIQISLPPLVEQQRIVGLLDEAFEGLATGTGKTFIAFQIAWKLFHSRWNLSREATRRPRILFLADRNILANQAYNSFSAFPEDALVRIDPADIRKKGKVPKNGSLFFTIFQTFLSGPNDSPYFGDYPKDFFDFIIIDECHRGGANDESNWRGILDYFSPAVQLGLTATPRRKDNVDTYAYFGDPVYIYSLKDGINDGFLTPFRLKQIATTLDEYIYTPDDTVVEGEIEAGKRYEEADFNRILEIKEREKKRVEIFLSQIHPNEKTLVFCANQAHALAVRDLINQLKTSKDPNYCQRVTADDGALGEQYLRDFQDNEKTIPTILTTSQKLSTGVDARNVRNIVLMRPVNSMIEFKQIIGRGTRLYDGKDYFTIHDFVKAHIHFSDPEWDGEPAEPEVCEKFGCNPCQCENPPPKACSTCGKRPCECPKEVCPVCGRVQCLCEKRKKTKVKLADGKERSIQHMMSTTFWHPDGTPMSSQQFLEQLFGRLPEFFASEDELRAIWSAPGTRYRLLEGLAEAGFGNEQLAEMQKIIDAENSDLFDLLAHVAYAKAPLTREVRAANAMVYINTRFSAKQQVFLDFVLQHYIAEGVEELDQQKLTPLLRLKYGAIQDAVADLGQPEEIGMTFASFQQYLYAEKVA